MLKALRFLSRQTIYFALLGCMFTPIFAARIAGMGCALLCVLPCTCGAWFLLSRWERKMQKSVSQLLHSKLERIQEGSIHPEREIALLIKELEENRLAYEHQLKLMHTTVAKSKEEVHGLHLEMDKKLEHMRLAYLEFEDLRKEYLRLEEELLKVQEESQDRLRHKDSLISEYQITIAEQRKILEQKQRHIVSLEAKVRELMFEIRSLLQMEQPPLPPKTQNEKYSAADQPPLVKPSGFTPYDLSLLLQKYIEKAENLTGAEHLGYRGGSSPRFLDLSLESSTLDKRRLLDSFKDESGGAVFVYSLREKKFLFVNSAVKSLVGWTPEKFIKEFPQLVSKGYDAWEDALSKISTKKECQTRLALINKAGESSACNCYMGMVNKGPFAHHVIGLFTH